MKVLCLNAGSSSLKVALIDATERGESRLAEMELPMARHGEGADELLRSVLSKASAERPDAIGHRFVSGGPHQVAPLLIDGDAHTRLQAAVPFAPLHLLAEIAVMDAASLVFPGVPQVACFDTAFHSTLPDVAQRLPVAGWADAKGVRRYGFHGLSYEYVVSHLGAEVLGDAVIAHLGSGASLAAVRDGRSIDTTMGMSPCGGLMMGTRTGDIDPGAIVYLLENEKWGARDLERFVNSECGLLGVSGSTPDMRQLLSRRAQDPRARLAVALFVYTAQKAIGAFAVALGGLSSLVFTGGIGARSPILRAEIAERLGFLGVVIDPARNEAGAAVISPDGARCTVRCLETDEQVIIARHVRECIEVGRA